MRIVLLIVISLFLLFSTNSCKLDLEELTDKDEFFTIKGRLLKSCTDRTPLADKNLRIDAVSNIFFKDVIVPETHTDANGFFTFRYENEGGTSFLRLSLREKNSQGSTTDIYLVTQLPVFTNIDLGDIFIEQDKPYIVELKTSLPFSTRDTLFYDIQFAGSKDSTFKFIVGPFVNKQIIDRGIADGIFRFQVIENPSDFEHGDYEAAWILKSGPRVHKKSFNNDLLKPCIQNSVIIDLTK